MAQAPSGSPRTSPTEHQKPAATLSPLARASSRRRYPPMRPVPSSTASSPWPPTNARAGHGREHQGVVGPAPVEHRDAGLGPDGQDSMASRRTRPRPVHPTRRRAARPRAIDPRVSKTALVLITGMASGRKYRRRTLPESTVSHRGHAMLARRPPSGRLRGDSYLYRSGLQRGCGACLSLLLCLDSCRVLRADGAGADDAGRQGRGAIGWCGMRFDG